MPNFHQLLITSIAFSVWILVAIGDRLVIDLIDFVHEKGHSSFQRAITCEISQIHPWLLLDTNRKSYMRFQNMMLNLTLGDLKYEVQGHKNFKCRYLIN